MRGPRDVYCLHFYEKGKRKWLSVGTELDAANLARGQKEQELLILSKDEATPAETIAPAPKSLEDLRAAPGSTAPQSERVPILV